eukprot:CAMPEP_0175069410 /NCGR_PEP_ID=MMETSP0052_2-20121109/18180_1 /TAXON_ID=51329 ORGANISM="Polytomella parva, Strain SAG 63-3" /NCGR_SAMPLE_ID=MMETSP0052_2 /ASSEMBLY_ACC=CAM_ASM_000194 /LENGTH=46 /DNA_ID= /DNA_START= /DNA_END= /DNA_ORIENTATION=
MTRGGDGDRDVGGEVVAAAGAITTGVGTAGSGIGTAGTAGIPISNI